MPATQNGYSSSNEHGALVKWDLQKRSPRPSFVRDLLWKRKMNELLCRKGHQICRKPPRMNTKALTCLNHYRENPQCGHTVWGKNQTHHQTSHMSWNFQTHPPKNSNFHGDFTGISWDFRNSTRAWLRSTMSAPAAEPPQTWGRASASCDQTVGNMGFIDE